MERGDTNARVSVKVFAAQRLRLLDRPLASFLRVAGRDVHAQLVRCQLRVLQNVHARGPAALLDLLAQTRGPALYSRCVGRCSPQTDARWRSVGRTLGEPRGRAYRKCDDLACGSWRRGWLGGDLHRKRCFGRQRCRLAIALRVVADHWCATRRRAELTYHGCSRDGRHVGGRYGGWGFAALHRRGWCVCRRRCARRHRSRARRCCLCKRCIGRRICPARGDRCSRWWRCGGCGFGCSIAFGHRFQQRRRRCDCEFGGRRWRWCRCRSCNGRRQRRRRGRQRFGRACGRFGGRGQSRLRICRSRCSGRCRCIDGRLHDHRRRCGGIDQLCHRKWRLARICRCVMCIRWGLALRPSQHRARVDGPAIAAQHRRRA